MMESLTLTGMFPPSLYQTKTSKDQFCPSSYTKSLPWPLALIRLSIHSSSNGFWELALCQPLTQALGIYGVFLSSQQKHSRGKTDPLNRCLRSVVMGAATLTGSEPPVPNSIWRSSRDLWGKSWSLPLFTDRMELLKQRWEENGRHFKWEEGEGWHKKKEGGSDCCVLKEIQRAPVNCLYAKQACNVLLTYCTQCLLPVNLVCPRRTGNRSSRSPAFKAVLSSHCERSTVVRSWAKG